MENSNKIKVSSKNGIVIFGKIINNQNKLGQFEIHSPYHKKTNHVYHNYLDAESEVDRLIGTKTSRLAERV